jgi:solute carrier family 25 aspartate/glutamate transporter 12/13
MKRFATLRDSKKGAAEPFPSEFKTTQDKNLIRLALHKSPFFTCLDEEQVERLVAVAKLQKYQSGDVVIRQGYVDQDDDDDDDDDMDNTHGKEQGISQPSSSPPIEVATPKGAADDDAAVDEVAAFLADEQTETELVTAQEAAVLTNDSTEGSDESSSSSIAADETFESPALNATDENDFIDINDEPKDDTPPSIPPTDAAAAAVVTQPSSSSSSSSNTPPTKKVSMATRYNTTTYVAPPPPKSGTRRSVYIVNRGNADVWYQSEGDFNPASLGPGTLFGEGGFLFGRQHSASVKAGTGGTGTAAAGTGEPLECWVVDIGTFRNHVLPSDNMSLLFHKYATKSDATGAVYMTMEDFVEACERQESDNMPTLQDPLVGLRIANTYKILRQRHTQEGDNDNEENAAPPRVYLADFCFFHLLMARPDPEVDIAFLLMDQKETGQIDLDDLANFVRPVFPTLNLKSQFFERYFGADGQQSIREIHFSQFLLDLQREMGEQTFMRAVAKRGARQGPGGHLSPPDFVWVLKKACGWRLPEGVANRLENLFCHGPIEAGEAAAMASLRAGSLSGASPSEVMKATEASVIAGMEEREKHLGERYFAYGDFVAFQEVLANLPGICNLIDRCQEIKKGPVSRDDFKVANRVMGLGGRLSRRQVNIIFQLFDLDRDGYVSHEDTVSVCGVDFAQRLVAVEGRGGKLTFAPPTEYRYAPDDIPAEEETVALQQVGAYVQHTTLMSFASALGVVLTYPLDIVKTRLMNMRVAPDGKRMYLNSMDCLRQILRVEGFAGLFRGVVPQLLLVAPEKAIKLQVYDLLRRAFSSSDAETGTKKLHFSLEMLAGACAGACQLLVTNPMEMIKIRLQMEGETSRLLHAKGLTPPSALTMTCVCRDLGFPGVYRGASACLLRDIPFTAMYFPSYTAIKNLLVEQRANGLPTSSDLLLAGTLAGVPAAFLTTPADVIKTRLQVTPRPGEAMYTGIGDCAQKIYVQEGLPGLFRGSAVRVVRIAPQFGISLLAYEKLSEWIGLSSADRPPTDPPVDPADYRTAFPARAFNPKSREIDGWLSKFGFQDDNDPPKGR